MANLPLYISVAFGLTTLLAVWLFYNGFNRSKRVLGIITAWIILQSLIGLSGFYMETNTLPPRFLILVVPPFLCTLILFLTKRGRVLIDTLDTKWLTWLHVVRVPVEFVLFLLFMNKLIPEIMTFEGRNFDIISGISAPIIAYFYYAKKKIGRGLVIAWNILCLALVLNIVIYGIFSVPYPFQRFGFEQPNVGVLYFPFLLLPGFIVPAVIFSHLVCIRQLLKAKA
jgi:multisubunit Na+/H+ antiporter MnhF subunit